MAKLKACPFCAGRRLKTDEPYTGAGHYRVHCETCGAEGPKKDSVAEASDAWNTRNSTRGDGGEA